MLLAIAVLVACFRSSRATAALGIGAWLCARMYSALIDWSIVGDVGPCLGDAFGEVPVPAGVPRYAIEWTPAASFVLAVSWVWYKMMFKAKRS